MFYLPFNDFSFEFSIGGLFLRSLSDAELRIDFRTRWYFSATTNLRLTANCTDAIIRFVLILPYNAKRASDWDQNLRLVNL
jgi:hypothetical protein